jgi:hypothetical protein
VSKRRLERGQIRAILGSFFEVFLNLILLEGFVDFSIALYPLCNAGLSWFLRSIDGNEKPA